MAWLAEVFCHAINWPCASKPALKRLMHTGR
jgi:hypothetical protein